MNLYSVYEPASEASDLLLRAERLAFVKEGFSWPALLVPLFWLIYQRMWIELGVCIAVLAALQWLFGLDARGEALFGWVGFALVVLFAFEANDLRGAALKRRGYSLAGIAMGRDREAAEIAFLRSWLPPQLEQTRAAAAGLGRPERGGKAADYSVTAPDDDEVIGLFPRA